VEEIVHHAKADVRIVTTNAVDAIAQAPSSKTTIIDVFDARVRNLTGWLD
jgi:hypothetical protein